MTSDPSPVIPDPKLALLSLILSLRSLQDFIMQIKGPEIFDLKLWDYQIITNHEYFRQFLIMWYIVCRVSWIWSKGCWVTRSDLKILWTKLTLAFIARINNTRHCVRTWRLAHTTFWEYEFFNWNHINHSSSSSILTVNARYDAFWNPHDILNSCGMCLIETIETGHAQCVLIAIVGVGRHLEFDWSWRM